MSSPQFGVRRAWRGFTLIELLVAIGLATILVSTVVMIFSGSTDIFKTSESRITIYGNARAAMDVLARDLSSMLPLDGGQQRMCIVNGCRHGQTAQPAGPPFHEGPDRSDPAQDSMEFRAIIPLNNLTHVSEAILPALPSPTLMTAHVVYQLRLDDDPEVLGVNPTFSSTQNVNPGGGAETRPLFVLRKRVYDVSRLAPPANPSGTVALSLPVAPQAPPYPAPAVDPPGSNNALYQFETGDLCHYVVSFNIEWINTAPPPAGWVGSQHLPAGAAVAGVLATPVGIMVGAPPVPNGRLPQAVRVTLRVAEGAAIRQERIISRVIWIPLS